MRGKLNMLTNFVFTARDGSTHLASMVHLEIDFGEDLISIALDNGELYVISKNTIIKEEHTDNSDLYECLDGTRYYIEYPEFV